MKNYSDSLLLVTSMFMGGNTTVLLILLASGCVSVCITNFFFPADTRYLIACAMMTKHKKAGDKSTNPYFYYFRCEQEHNNGKTIVKISEIIMRGISMVFRIINYFFNLLSILMLIVLTGAIAVIWGGVLLLFSIIVNSPSVRDFAKMCCKPFILSLKLLPGALLPRGIYARYFREGVEATEQPQTENSKVPGEFESALNFKNYFSIDGIVLPGNCHWDGTPTVSVMGTSATVRCGIIADGIAYHTQSDLDALIRKVVDLVNENTKPQIKKYREDFPLSPDIKLEVNIDAKIV